MWTVTVVLEALVGIAVGDASAVLFVVVGVAGALEADAKIVTAGVGWTRLCGTLVLIATFVIFHGEASFTVASVTGAVVLAGGSGRAWVGITLIGITVGQTLVAVLVEAGHAVALVSVALVDTDGVGWAWVG